VSNLTDVSLTQSCTPDVQRRFPLFIYEFVTLSILSFSLRTRPVVPLFLTALLSVLFPSRVISFCFLCPFHLFPPICVSLSLYRRNPRLAFLQAELLKSLSSFIHFQVKTLACEAYNLAFRTSPKALHCARKCLYLKSSTEFAAYFRKLRFRHGVDDDWNKFLRSDIQLGRRCDVNAMQDETKKKSISVENNFTNKECMRGGGMTSTPSMSFVHKK
jgi:hypothetical protein